MKPATFGTYHLLETHERRIDQLTSYTAVDGALEDLRVVHVIRPSRREAMQEVLRHIRPLRGNRHPNLVAVIEADEVGSEGFIVCDHSEGRDLHTVWNRCADKRVAFPIEIAADIVRQLARGLAHACRVAAPVAFLPIPPAAVHIGSSGRARVDLTAVALRSQLTPRSSRYIPYITPDHARGRRPAPTNSVYSLGILLWELLTGRQLFPPEQDRDRDLARRQHVGSVVKPSERAPRVPKELDPICARAFRRCRWCRFRSCDHLGRELERFLSNRHWQEPERRLAAFMAELYADDFATERSKRADMLRALRVRPVD
jgi:eukaryotic-like serine/threonine-protein kinase